MKKALIKKIKTDKNLVKELRRAHFIIVLLALGVGMLTGVLIKTNVIMQALGVITIALVTVVGLISIFVIVRISKP